MKLTGSMILVLAVLVSASAWSAEPATISSIRPKADVDAQANFDRLSEAIGKLPRSQRETAAQTLIQAAGYVGQAVFDAYLSSGFLDTYSGKKVMLDGIVKKLAGGDVEGFERDAMGSGPYQP